MADALLKEIGQKFGSSRPRTNLEDEILLDVDGKNYSAVCLFLHKRLDSPVMSLFAVDERKKNGHFGVHCVFLDTAVKRWVIVRLPVKPDKARFPSLAGAIHSAGLFEREIFEMFGLKADASPDERRLRLHDETWPAGYFPLRKDFAAPKTAGQTGKDYQFMKIEGEGVFEVPVGPVHAGIIGPGHFRFSVAGEPIINLEIRLGFTHRGVEKLFESKDIPSGLRLAECVAGDSAFGHGTAFASAVEKIRGVRVSDSDLRLRAVFLELERICNHAGDIGGMALDVGFSFPSAMASLLKESIHDLNERLTGSRYLKNANRIGGVSCGWDRPRTALLLERLDEAGKNLNRIESILTSSVSFMDRLDGTGILRTRTARDLGVLGLAGRAAGIAVDMRKIFPGVYGPAGFEPVVLQKGDAYCRLQARIREIRQSSMLIHNLVSGVKDQRPIAASDSPGRNGTPRPGRGLACAEGWRGPVLYWVDLGPSGTIDRCKITDPSFRNWEGLSFAVLGNIVPDFPVCNKSFDLSYPGNDL